MGMSASQTRYVLLTGKKSDVEFHGQQINQQRTTLATESSAYNAQLLNLKVPTPPSASDFTTTTYTIIANGNPVKITGSHFNTDPYTLGTDPTIYPANSYTVYYDEDVTGPEGKSAGSALFTSITNAGGLVTGFRVNMGSSSDTLEMCNVTDGTPGFNPTDASNVQKIIQDCTGFPVDAGTTDNPVFKYTTGAVTKYVALSQLEASADTPNAIPVYYVDPDATYTKHSKIGGAQITWNESGRMTSITDVAGNNYATTVNTTSDNSAYTDAMNEYEFQKAEYDKQMNDINARMSIIQGQDKKLELQLKDLDTQNNAIQTEMESVKKVVDKNIEQSFKAFA